MATPHPNEPYLWYDETSGRWCRYDPQTRQSSYVAPRSGYVEEAQQTLSQSRSNVEREETGESGRRRFSEASSGNDADTFSTLEQRMASTSLKDYTTTTGTPRSQWGQTGGQIDPSKANPLHVQPVDDDDQEEFSEQKLTSRPAYAASGHKKTSKQKSEPQPLWGQALVENDPAIPDLQYAPPHAITQPEIAEKGLTARAKIGAGGSKKNSKQRLDPRFVVPKQPKRFFTPGRVIKIFWPELAGDIMDAKTRVTSTDVRFKNIDMIGKIRWFVVVSTGVNACTCLPISTYGGRGVAKPGIVKWHHCIIYTEGQQPQLLIGEAPSENEQPMRTPIQVRPTQAGDRMDPASRLNYGKMYTVEHNVKVYDFGMVLPQYMQILIGQWGQVLDSMRDQERHNIAHQVAGNSPPTVPGPATITPTYVDFGYANATYTPPMDQERQIAIQKGDHLGILEWPYEEWAKAFNRRSRETGLVALQFIEMFPSAVALYDYEPTDLQSYLKLQRNDDLRVIEYPHEGWATVCNLRTAESGLVPKSYIASAS